MPSLVLFGHRLPVAGDDLRPLCLLYIGVHVMQIVISLVLITLSVAEMRDINQGSIAVCVGKDDDGEDLTFSEKIAGQFAPLSFVYFVCSVVLSSVYLATDISVWRLSDRGTPTEPEKRKALVPLCVCRIVPLGVIRFCIFALGLTLGIKLSKYCDCRVVAPGGENAIVGCSDGTALYTTFIILLFSQLGEMCSPAAVAVFTLLREGRRRTGEYAERELGRTEEHRWKLCCALCCNCTSLFTCCLCGGGEVNTGNYADISRTLAVYFDDGGKLDVVTTDIVAGLVMLLSLQKQRKIECRETLIADGAKDDSKDEVKQQQKSGLRHDSLRMSQAALEERMVDHGDRPGIVGDHLSQSLVYQLHHEGASNRYEAELRMKLSASNTHDLSVLAEGARYCRFALGIYTWKMYTMNRPCIGCCKLGGMWCWDAAQCARPCCSTDENVVGDNCCGWHIDSFLAETGLHKRDIAYAQFGEGFAQTPYCIAIDHEWKSVALVLRGTFSIDDAVADLTVSPASLENWGSRCGFDGMGEYAHTGMLACAEWIYEDIQRHGILEELLTGEASECSGYRLRVVGHSLGAGAAAIVAVMLKKQFTDLRCLSFEPPGCVFSQKTAKSCEEYVTSFVVGDDVVPRLSLQSMEHLRDEVLWNIARIKVPKHEVLALFANRGRDNEDMNSTMLHRRCSVPKSTFSAQLEEFQSIQQTKKMESALPDVIMYPPGEIVHLLKTSKDDNCMHGCVNCCTCGLTKTQEEFTARWTTIDDFHEIVISPTMLGDHEPFGMSRRIERVAKSFGLVAPYRDYEELREEATERPRDEEPLIVAKTICQGELKKTS